MRQFEHFPNLVTLFFRRAAENGTAPFLWHKADRAWQSISWAETARQVASLAVSLGELGLVPGDRVMLVSENRPEWCIADLGIMAAGCITVPTYTTNAERDHQHIIEDSGASAIIVSTQKLAAAVMPAALRATRAQHIIGIEPLRVGQTTGVKAHDWSALVGKTDVDVKASAANAETAFRRDDLACIIYTSGTGGAPRGVQQHHGAIFFFSCVGDKGHSLISSLSSGTFSWPSSLSLPSLNSLSAVSTLFTPPFKSISVTLLLVLLFSVI